MVRSRKGTAILLAILFVGTNLAGLVVSHQRRNAEAATNAFLMELKGKQGKEFKLWHDADVTPIGSSVCNQGLSCLGVAKELPVPTEGQAIAKEDLDPAVVEELNDTVRDLLLAYKKGRPVHIVNYMRTRDETLSSKSVARMKKYLFEHFGFQHADLEGKSDEEIYSLCWDVDSTDPAFDALLVEKCGISFWTISDEATVTISNQEEFGSQDYDLWRWRTMCDDNFSNQSDTIDEQVSKSGDVKVADVRLVVKHRGAAIHSICPYVIRFWYSNTREKWIPCLFQQIRTSRDIPEHVYF